MLLKKLTNNQARLYCNLQNGLFAKTNYSKDMKARDVNKGLPLIDVCSVEYALKLLLLDCHSKTWHVQYSDRGCGPYM